MTRPRVTQLITGLGIGGAERLVLDLAGQMHRHGWPVLVVGMDDRVDILDAGYQDGLEILSLGFEKAKKLSPSAFYLFLRTLSIERPQVIHAHMYHALLMALFWKALHPNVKIVFTSHNFRFSGFRRLVIRLSKFARSCDVVFFRSQHRELNARNVAVIPNGTPVRISEPRTRLNVPERPWRIIAVGRLVPQKAIMALVEQFSLLRRKDVVLDIVGDGVQRSEIEKMVFHLGLQDRIKLLGARTDIPSLLDRSDLFVLASEWEGMPISALEAGARGLPILSTPVGGMPEMLEGECGFVAERRDFPEMIDMIFSNYEAALRNADKFRRKVAENYSIEAVAGAHCALYDKLLLT